MPTTLTEELPAALAERIVEQAQDLTGAPAALYAVDIEGTQLRRVTGAAGLPAQIALTVALGPELSVEGLADLRATLESMMAGGVAAPLWVRGRATCVIVAVSGSVQELEGLAARAAGAVELACGYTDLFSRARRHKPATAAAEIQQDLLAPRIAPITGGAVAGSLMPAYEVGGDWFDHAENPEGVWLGVADAMGRGARAAAVSAVAIGAFRAARRAGDSLEQCCSAIDTAVDELGTRTFVTAVLATWDIATATLSWINCGHPPPLLLSGNGDVRELVGEGTHPLGMWRETRGEFRRNQVPLERGARVVLYSDGLTDRRTSAGGFLGLDGLLALLAGLGGASAVAIVHALEGRIREISDAPLADDATQLVLAYDG